MFNVYILIKNKNTFLKLVLDARVYMCTCLRLMCMCTCICRLRTYGFEKFYLKTYFTTVERTIQLMQRIPHSPLKNLFENYK